MKEIADKWHKFSTELINENRFFLENSIINDISSLLSFCTQELKAGTEYYRARIYSGDENDRFNKRLWGKVGHDIKEMGTPPKDKTTNGRANPEGISYLYLASSERTAISEVRPWIDAEVSVGTCILKQNIRVFNPILVIMNDDLQEYHNLAGYLTVVFSRPVNPNSRLDYLPTQYVSEYIKKQGFDGIVFLSALNKNGLNLVVFNDSNVEFTSVKHFKISKTEYLYQPINPPERPLMYEIAANAANNVAKENNK